MRLKITNVTPSLINFLSYILSTVALILGPSKDHIINICKLLILSTCALVLVLYASGYIFPGGAVHYTDWAFALVNDTKLPLGHAQREVGLPILYLMTGLTYFKSFIGPTLAYAVFGVLIVIANYLSVSKASSSVGYYSSAFLILTLAPFSYIKFFYPDQLYIFLIQMFLMYMALFLWKGKISYLYLFAIFAIFASLTRTSGNLLFVLLLIVLYLYKRSDFKHYLACLLIGAAVFGINQAHRFNVFDIANQTETKPVGKGYQILYSTYMWMGEFGYKITPELGPNSKLLLERMREELSPSPREAKLVSNQYGQTPAEFMEEHVYKYNTEQLIEKVLTEPGEEYFYNIILPIKRVGLSDNNSDDEFHLNIVKEIWTAYPLYVLKYGLRNLALMLFDPGWSSPRYVKAQFTRQGVEFVAGSYGWGGYSTDSVTSISSRAAREHEFHQLKLFPVGLQKAFDEIKNFYIKYYRLYVYLTSFILILGWFFSLVYLIERLTGAKIINYNLSDNEVDKVCTIMLITSLVLLYENSMTAWFSQPHFRYFHMTESCRFMILSLTLVLLLKLKGFRAMGFSGELYKWLTVSVFNALDEQLIRRKRLVMLISIIILVSSLIIWSKNIVNNTWGEPQIRITDAYYQSSNSDVIKLNQREIESLLSCQYFRCKSHLPQGSKIYALNDRHTWLLAISYHCRNSNETRFTTSRVVDGLHIFELDCY